MGHQPTIADVLEAVQSFAKSVDERFNAIDDRFSKIETTMSTFVDRDYLDRRLGELKGDLIVIMKKQDAKVDLLVDAVERHKEISRKEANDIRRAGPFPKILPR